MVDSPEPGAKEGGPLPLDHPFVEAVSRLDLEGVEEMLTADPGLVDADLHGRAWIGGPRRTAAGWERAPDQSSRAVHLAAYGHAGLLRLLIAHGADLNAPGYEGNHGWAPPLVLACWEGTVETVRLLLEAGADPNLPSRPGGSALHAAINHYDAEKIELLLRHGARHDLYSAAAVGDLEEVERQLAAGDGLLDRRDDLRGRTPLEWAVFNGREEVARHLLEAGAAASPQILIGLGKLDEVRQLAEADPGLVNRPLDPEREPPLMHALRSRNLEMVKLLLRLGADPAFGGWEPGADAESHGRDGIPLTFWRGQSPLARAGDPAFAEILIDAGADVNGEFIPGRSLLFHHLRHGRFDVARLLLSRGADPDRLGQSRGGTTTLQSLVAPDGVEARELARRGDHVPAMKLLLDRGAGVNTLSAEGLTALDYAVEIDSASVADFLRQRGGRRARDLDTQEGGTMDNKLTRAFESREGRKLTDRELRFLHAAGHGGDGRGRGATSDVGRMRALLGEQPSLLDTVGPVALNQAVGCNRYDAVRLLLDRGVRELYDGQTGRPREEQHEPITHAFYVGMGENEELDGEQVTRDGRFRILRTLFDAGIADASVISTSHVGWPGNTSLLYWAAYRRLEFSEFALEYGADPEAPISGNGERGTTVLQHAVAPPFDGASAPWINPEGWRRSMRFAEFLLSHGASYDIFSACGRDDLDRVRTLAANDPGAVTRPGEADMTPLHWAARAGAGQCTRWLLARGADVNAETVSRRTALHLVAEWGLTDMIWLLAGHGADLNPQDTKGRTPLHRAAYMGRVEAAEALIVLGADTRLETRTGKTALQSARFDCKFLKD